MASTVLRPIGHEDRLSLVDHLDELRTRLMVCVAAVLVAGGLAFWQEDRVLEVLNAPLAAANDGPGTNSLERTAVFDREAGETFAALGPALGNVRDALAGVRDVEGLSPGQRQTIEQALAGLSATAAQAGQAAAAVPPPPPPDGARPVTLGVAEPFTVTLSVALYTGVLLAMPLLLYQFYAFVLPAFSPTERRVALPLMLLVPLLFIGGVLFAYFVVLTRAIDFLQNFNADSFDVQIQARDYYKFSILFMAAIGLLFQIPVAVLALTRTGVVSTQQLRKGRGYVILGFAVITAVATPTPDPVTMLLAMAPLVVLYELSILMVRWLDRIKPPAVVPAVGDEDFDQDAP